MICHKRDCDLPGWTSAADGVLIAMQKNVQSAHYDTVFYRPPSRGCCLSLYHLDLSCMCYGAHLSPRSPQNLFTAPPLPGCPPCFAAFPGPRGSLAGAFTTFNPGTPFSPILPTVEVYSVGGAHAALPIPYRTVWRAYSLACCTRVL